MSMVVKTGGTDRELGAAILGRQQRRGILTGDEAAQRLLAEIDGWPRATSSGSHVSTNFYGSYGSYGYWDGDSAMDRAGKFLPNGGCAYIDLGHPEICTAEVRSAWQYAACVQAMTGVVQDAMRVANVKLDDGEELVVYVDNSDRQGNSYGSHLNVTVSRELWEDTFQLRLMPHLRFLASFQASSIVLTGGGKVGNEDGTPDADYQLSRRADFIKTFVAPHTTFNRPMINSRDEALGEQARLHCIFWDAVLLPAANYLQFGCLQLVTALMEEGAHWMQPTLLLDDPLQALEVWSRDPELSQKARLAGGAQVTALEHQEMILDHVERFVSTGACDEAVADAADVVAYWRETLGYLIGKDEDRAARRVEWLAKRRVLEAAMQTRRDLNWQSLEIRALDLGFGDLNTERGVYWALLRNGEIDQLSTASDISYYKHNPPADTRAQARTSLIRQLGHEQIVSVDWAEIRVRHNHAIFSVRLPEPDRSVVALSDLTAELVEQAARDFRFLQPYTGSLSGDIRND